MLACKTTQAGDHGRKQVKVFWFFFSKKNKRKKTLLF
jgi:hypothetical protein